jgi:hypothetical protein
VTIASAGESFANRSNARRAAAAFKADAAKTDFEVYADSGGKHRWRARSRNGQTVASSGESFERSTCAVSRWPRCHPAERPASAGLVCKRSGCAGSGVARSNSTSGEGPKALLDPGACRKGSR